MSKEIHMQVDDYEVAGRAKAPSRAVAREHPPLIVAVHGGGFTSAYFDCEGYSLLDRAAAAGCPAVGIDRPGYGASSRLPEGDRAVPRNAEWLQAVIAQIWHQREHDARGVVLVGHSIGSAIVNCLASEATDWPLLGVAFSGLLLSPPSNVPPFWTFRRPEEWVHNPSQERLGRMFGPPGTYAPGAPELCDSVSRPAWWREIVELYTWWEQEFAGICSKVRVPVHCRNGALDALWKNGRDETNRLVRAFTRAPSVDAKLVPDTGHCIDFHLTSGAFHAEQIAFALDCSTRDAAGAT